SHCFCCPCTAPCTCKRGIVSANLYNIRFRYPDEPHCTSQYISNSGQVRVHDRENARFPSSSARRQQKRHLCSVPGSVVTAERRLRLDLTPLVVLVPRREPS